MFCASLLVRVFVLALLLMYSSGVHPSSAASMIIRYTYSSNRPPWDTWIAISRSMGCSHLQSGVNAYFEAMLHVEVGES